MKIRHLRLLCVAAVIPAMLALSACGDSSAPSMSNAPAAQGGGGNTNTLESVKDEGKIVVGVKFDTMPFGFVPEGQSEPAGFDIDLASEFGKRLGVDVEFVQVTTKNRMPNLETGKIDMIMASMVKTEEREKVIDFSKLYFSDGQTLLVLADSPITGVDDLAGKTVSLAQGGFEGANVVAAVPDVKILSYQSWPEALQAMLRGESDAVSSTVGVLSGLSSSAIAAGKQVKTVGDEFADGPVAAGFRKGDDELRQAFDDALVDMVNDGTYEKISNKWWSDVRSEPFQVDTSSSK